MVKVLLYFCFPVVLLAQSFDSLVEVDTLKFARTKHAMVVLPNGNILATGNDTFTEDNRSCEIFNLDTKEWAETTPLNSGKGSHNMVLLDNGLVLAFGGILNRSCELFDPSTQEWRFTDSTINKRNSATSEFVKLNDGRIMLIGGSNLFEPIDYAVCEIYDPATETWSQTSPMNHKRGYGHVGVVLGNNKVLVTGGYNSEEGTISSVELYDPNTDLWTEADSLIYPRREHTLNILDENRILLIGGRSFNSEGSAISYNNALIYNISENTWEELSEIQKIRHGHSTILVDENKALLIGGTEYISWEVYDFNVKSSILLEQTDIQIQMTKESIINISPNNLLLAGGLKWEYFDGLIYFSLSNKSFIFDFFTSISETPELSTAFELYQNYPNPFNPSTQISFLLKTSQSVNLKIYNSLGESIKTLLNDQILKEGQNIKHWDGKNDFGVNQSSGVYFIELQVGGNKKIIKAVLQK